MQKEVSYSEKEEEIDLAKVFGNVRSALSRTKFLFLAFFAAGVILAVFYYVVVPRTYKSRMIISSTAFQGPSFMVILDNLKLLLEEKNYEELAVALQMDLETAQRISKIDVFSSKSYAKEEFGDNIIFKEEKVQDVANTREEFVIVAYGKDNEIFKILEKGILAYLNNNPAIKEISALRQSALADIKVNISKQRRELDSLKTSLASILTKESLSKDVYIGEPGAMYSNMIDMYYAELSATEALLASKITVIESFRTFKKQHSPRLGITLIAFTFIFMSLYIATVIFLEGNRNKKVV